MKVSEKALSHAVLCLTISVLLVATGCSGQTHNQTNTQSATEYPILVQGYILHWEPALNGLFIVTSFVIINTSPWIHEKIRETIAMILVGNKEVFAYFNNLFR